MLGVYRPILGQMLFPPHFRYKVQQWVSCYWGERPPLQALGRTKSMYRQLIVRHVGPQNTLKKVCVLFFTWINPDLPCTILLADTVKLFCLLNRVQQVHWTPHGWLLPQILWSAGQKPPPIFRIKVVHKGSGVGLYSELYDTSIAVWVVWVDSCGQNLFLKFIEYL